MCTCHDREIDHAFDDDIDQYVVPWRQNSPQEATERPQETSSGTEGIGGGSGGGFIPYVPNEQVLAIARQNAERWKDALALLAEQEAEDKRRQMSHADRGEGDQR